MMVWLLAVVALLLGFQPHAVPFRPVSRVSALPPGRTGLRPVGSSVAVLRSQASLSFAGWVGQWQFDSCLQTLRTIGLTPEPVDAWHLPHTSARILVLPNTRCMTALEVQAVRRFYRNGGRVLATYLSSYRDEKNQAVGPGNHFQLADLFGCDVYSWANGAGVCETLRPTNGPPIELGRNTAMLVRAAPGSEVLARWVDRDGQPPAEAAAVVATARTVYLGEDLFVADNNQSGQVKRYLASLFDRLGAQRRPVAGWDATVVHLGIPYPTDAPQPPDSGPPIRVGLDVVPAFATCQVEVLSGHIETRQHGAWVEVPSVTLDRLTRIEYRDTVLQTPALVGFTSVGEAFRAASPITLKPVGRGYVVLEARHQNGTGSLRAYRGDMQVTATATGLQLVNVLSLESYTAGVVPNEMAPIFPQQALEAMSVIARTFALSHMGRHADEGFDVCNTVHCQVYGGMLSEWVSSNAAVQATEGVVAWAGDRPADTTFHACCGGVGEAVEKVWEQPPVPYLVGYVDGPGQLPDLSGEAAFRTFIDHPPESYCQNSARFRWTLRFTWNQLDDLFRQSLSDPVGHVQALNVLERSSGGRIQTLQIVGTTGQVEVHKDAIRWLWSGGKVGTGGLPSTLFYVDSDADGVTLHGGGWGHGVGMCQEGAGGMARAGADYRTIIQHYYPGVTLRTQASSMGFLDRLEEALEAAQSGA